MVRSKHCTPERWLCYTISVALVLAVVAVVVVVTLGFDEADSRPENPSSRNGQVWHYVCEANQCVKHPILETTADPLGLVMCRQTCGMGARSQGLDVWPKLTGTVDAGNSVVFAPIWLPEFRFREPAAVITDVPFWRINHERLMAQIRNKRAAKTSAAEPEVAAADRTAVTVSFVIASNDAKLHMAGNETYRLTIGSVQNRAVAVTIEADTIFGARHGIETLSQLVFYDDMSDRYLVRA